MNQSAHSSVANSTASRLRHGLSTTQEKFAFTVFERTFQEFGDPAIIHADNGVPFASAPALYGLSELSVWWLRLGIALERSSASVYTGKAASWVWTS